MIVIEKHPPPKLDDEKRIICNGLFFSKLYPVQVYLQLELDNNAKHVRVIKGL